MEQVIGLVRHALSQDDPVVQATACEGTAKLMLAGMIEDVTVCYEFGDCLSNAAERADPSITRLVVLLSRDRGQPGAATMLDVLLTSVLLCVPNESAPYAFSQ